MQMFRRSATRRRLDQMIREGIGLHESRWQLPSNAQESDAQELVEPIVEWVRQSMGEMRRPNGIDQVALALACRDENGRVLCSNSFGVLRPAAFYEEDGVDRVAAFMADVEAVPGEQRREIIGALLSLGDIAYEMQLARAA